MTRIAVPIVAVATFVSACATAPEKISPTFVSADVYAAQSCEQLGSSEQRVQSELEKASASQRNARGVDTVGVALVGLPAASLLGRNRAKSIAKLKGEQEAIWRQSTRLNCAVSLDGGLHVADAAPRQGAARAWADGADHRAAAPILP